MNNLLDKILLNFFIFILNGILPAIGNYYLIMNLFNNNFLIVIPVCVILFYNMIYLISFFDGKITWGENTIFILIENTFKMLKESCIKKYNIFENWCKLLKNQ